jgi:hypothetical protein
MAEVASWLVGVPAMLVLGHVHGAQGVAAGLVLGSGVGLIFVTLLAFRELRSAPAPSQPSLSRFAEPAPVDVGGSS